MSTRRDLIWFRSDSAVHWTTAIAANTLLVHSITANATRTKDGIVLTDAHKQLKGTIEHIRILLNTAMTGALEVTFWAKASAESATPNVDEFIDHESFVGTQYFTVNGQTKPKRSASSGLAIPYVDRDGTKKFHIGIRNSHTAAAIPKNTIVLEWAWRPDLGEQ
mgnify:FL=1